MVPAGASRLKLDVDGDTGSRHKNIGESSVRELRETGLLLKGETDIAHVQLNLGEAKAELVVVHVLDSLVR